MHPLLHAALVHRQAGRWTEAADSAERLVREQSTDAQAWMLLADLRRQLRLNSAGEAYDRVLALQADHLPALYGRAQWLDHQGRHAEAVLAYNEVIQRRPTAAEAHYNLARMHWALKAWAPCAAALEAADAALRTAPASAAPTALGAQVAQLRAQCLEATGDAAAALASLERAVTLAPQRASAWHDLGAARMRRGLAADALTALDRARDLGSTAADTPYIRGNALQTLGELDAAEAAYRQTLQRQPAHELALYDLARLRWRRGHADWSAELEALAEQAAASALPCGLLGRLRLNAGDAAGAAAAYEEALRRAPGTPGLLDGLAQAKARQGDLPSALALHQAACEQSPSLVEPWVNWAATQLRAGQAAGAAAAAEAALQRDPQHQVAWAHLGTAWRCLGDARADWLHDYAHHIHSEDLPAPPGWSDAAAFNAALRDWLDTQHHDSREPIDQTLRRGTQTVGNLFDRPDPMAQALKALVWAAVSRFIEQLRQLPPDAQHPLLSRIHAPAWRITDSWSSRLQQRGHHSFHAHSHGWISACYYVQVPTSVQTGLDPAGPDAGCIAFGRPDAPVGGQTLSALRVIRPRPGRLALFPSSMWHGTLPFDDDAARLTVAFDVVPVMA